ncbi:MAG TPA: glycine cleavage T C-terminal barrel domain-containing protein [Polyangiaceae bacterium]|nr:glycine cleavage T C-terminal barrel domain-containing protein [Polyangiaceae bacterium]
MSDDRASDAARSGALLVHESAREVLVVTGPDRAAWLNGVVTCDVTKVRPGEAAFGLLLSKLGKLQTDFYALAAEKELLLACAPGTSSISLSELERMLVMEDAELGRPASELACLALHGPRAAELARAVSDRPGVMHGAVDRTGLGGAVLLVLAPELEAVVATLTQGGAVLAGDDDWLRLRIERQVGLFGVDYGPQDNPHEAAVERRAISWNKGCYLGQEVVFMQDARGKVKRRLALVALDGPVPPAGTPVAVAEGDTVGEVTSAAASTLLGRTVALARLKTPHFEPGAEVRVGGVSAVVRGEPV